MFPLIEEMGGKEVSGHHWYVLSINNTAQRFEALDSLRTKGNIGLIYHTNVVMRIIKEAWKLYYHKSRVQIENYELEIIDAPKQAVRSVHCGFYMLEYLDKWDGVNVPRIRKEDIQKIKKMTANKWLTTPFKKNKKWKQQLDNNCPGGK
uniref:Ubiquitin-like protease family profile domain-containing protein n=1 Tax=Hordeum vulgare subsp. vulgare TaxID=112509 RepID=A0A8I6XMZ4_HORVV